MVSFLPFLQGKRNKAGPAKPEETVQSTPAATASSVIMKDVLGKGGARDGAGAKPEPARPSGPPLSQRLSVGAQLADAKNRAAGLASKIVSVADAGTAEALEALAEDLEKLACCVAVIGQVKAGKSSLINVLLEEPGFLPADINPWTTVITKLHFGVPGKPQAGASFTFFNRAEWQRLSHGGRTRELTERILPDFDWNALRAQVEIMQKRAEHRLGPRYQDLLGTGHAYPSIVPGLLNRYVAAGMPDEAAPHVAGAEGEYSDITKTANLYFDLGAFSFPAILIDTPGVNDPFLVRDEITRQNLEGADLCVVVLTAKQPLSAADLNLLRMLRGLNKNRVIIFVNKADEIDGGEEVLQQVSHQLSAALSREFPATHFEIVCGSAIWARTALLSGHIQRDRKSLTAPPESQPASAGPASFEWPTQDEIGDTVSAETLFLKSGLSALAIAISEAMHTGPAAAEIARAAALAEAACTNLITWLEIEADVLSSILADTALAERRLAELTVLKDALSAEFGASSARASAFLAGKIGALKPGLARAVEETLSHLLNGLSAERARAQINEIDIKARMKLESAFLAAFEEASAGIAAEEERLRQELGKRIEAAELGGRLTLVPSRGLSLEPPLAALAEPAAPEYAAGPGADPKALAGCFEPIAGKLADEAGKMLNSNASALIEQSRALTLGPLEAAVQRLSARLHEMQSFGGNAHKTVRKEMEAILEKAGSLKLSLAAYKNAPTDS